MKSQPPKKRATTAKTKPNAKAAKSAKGAKPSKAKAAKASKSTKRPARAAAGGKPARRPSAPARKAPRAAAPEKKRKGQPAPEVETVAAAPVERPDPSRPRAMAIAHAGLDKKAEEVLVLDVRGLTSYADYFVVMTADSDRQASAIADHVDATLKAAGVEKVGVEGHGGGRWVLIDYGDVVAHVFSREARGFYDVEGLWADAVKIPVQD